MFLSHPTFLLIPHRKEQRFTICGSLTITGKSNIYAAGMGEALVELESFGESIRSKSSSSESIIELETKAYSNRHYGKANIVSELYATDNSLSNKVPNIKIYDEGILVERKLTSINFIGDNVYAELDGDVVNVIHTDDIPKASHFNTQDGATNGLVNNATTSQRYVSSPDSEGTPFYAGGWNNNALHPTTRSPLLVYSTNEIVLFYDKTTTIEVNISDPSGIISSYTTPIIEDVGNHINSGIEINITDWQEQLPRYAAKIEVRINISSILPNGGIFGVEIKHNNGPDIYSFTQ